MSHGPCIYGQTYSATKHLTDFVTLGLKEELKNYGVDVCAWRAAGVKTKLIAEASKGASGFLHDTATPLPDQYVEAAFKKCTSGAHHGYYVHEIIGLVIDNISDLFPWFGSFAMNKLCTEVGESGKMR